MKIVVLTSETPANVWLVNQILSRHDVAGIVIERRPLAVKSTDKLDRRRQMIERYGLLRTVNKLLYNQVRSRVLSPAAARTARDNFFPGGTPMAHTRQVPTLTVGNINDEACIRFITEKAPDVLAVCGTGILKPAVFSLAPKGTINIHTGITPEYRCADPIFWALYEGEPEKVGVTIHYVDKGIDTGPIIRQESVPVYATDSIPSISARCIRKGAQLYLRALGDIASGAVRIIDKSSVKGRSFLSVDLGLVQYLIFLARFRRMASRLPRLDAAASVATPEARI